MKLRIGGRLLAIREERNMTQNQMSDLLGIPDSTYARYERNETQIDYNKLVNFAERLKVPVQELLPDTVAINSNNNNSGQGGGIIFGNQYFYVGDSALNSALLQEIKELREQVVRLSDERK